MCRTCTLRRRPWSSRWCCWASGWRRGPSGQTTAAIRALHALRPDVVHLLSKTGEVDVPVAEVMVGDRLVVRPGERIPADGVVTEGRRRWMNRC